MKRFGRLVWAIAWALWLVLPIAAFQSSREAGRFARPETGEGSFTFCGNGIAEPLALALNYAFPGMILAGAALVGLSGRRAVSVRHAKAYCVAAIVSIAAFWFFSTWMFRTHFGDAARGVWWLP